MNEMPATPIAAAADIALLLARAARIIDISLELDPDTGGALAARSFSLASRLSAAPRE